MKAKKKNNNCLGCRIQSGKFKGLGGSVISTKYFDAHQDVYVPIPGFMILASKRHIQSIDEFTKQEANDFIELLIKLRMGMRKVLDIRIIYLFQEEDTSAHFHIWLFPVHPWMIKKFGKSMKMATQAMKYAQKFLINQKNIKKVNKAVSMLQIYFRKKHK